MWLCRAWPLGFCLALASGQVLAQFVPPRIVQVVQSLGRNATLGGVSPERFCYIDQGTEGRIHQGDELNVYRELAVPTSDKRVPRVFIGTVSIVESQRGVAVGRFTPRPDLAKMIQVRHHTVLKNDIVMPKIVINARALFDLGKAELKPGVADEFKTVVEYVQYFTPAGLVVEGHTDSDGDEVANQKLSEARAQSVRAYLTATYKFISPAMVQAKGFGESRPLVPNDSPENKALNRRVEIAVWY